MLSLRYYQLCLEKGSISQRQWAQYLYALPSIGLGLQVLTLPDPSNFPLRVLEIKLRSSLGGKQLLNPYLLFKTKVNVTWLSLHTRQRHFQKQTSDGTGQANAGVICLLHGDVCPLLHRGESGQTEKLLGVFPWTTPARGITFKQMIK